MASPQDSILSHLEKFRSRGVLDQMDERLKPLLPSERPLPGRLPTHPDKVEERLALAEAQSGALEALRGKAPLPSPLELSGNIENFVGFAQLPLGLAGPLRVRGSFANGDYYVPLASSEGALVASYSRGAGLVSQAGGVSCLSLPAWTQRAPGFAYASVLEAARAAAWCAEHADELKAAAATRSRHGRLVDISPHLEAGHLHLILSYHTGDAAGQNMVTVMSQAVCEHVVKHCPIKAEQWYIEANMSGDKKATALSLLRTRGRKVVAQARLSGKAVQEGLHVSVRGLCDYWHMSFVGGLQSGSVGVTGHVANALAALFIATGQDAACVSEAAIGVIHLREEVNGDLSIDLTLPNLIVGSVGGGTRLPHAQDCLRLLGCLGEGGADRLAEICAAICLAGELSIMGALASGDFAQAHATLGRPKP